MSSNFPDDMFDAQAPHGTVRYVLHGFFVRSDKPLTLIMRHAGHSNPAYMNARRKADLKLQAYGDSVPIDVTLDHVIPVFAQTVIVGWENAIGRDGKPIPCTPDEVEACLRSLSKRNADVVNRALGHAVPADHFRDVAAPMGTAEALGNG